MGLKPQLWGTPALKVRRVEFFFLMVTVSLQFNIKTKQSRKSQTYTFRCLQGRTITNLRHQPEHRIAELQRCTSENVVGLAKPRG